MSELLISSLIAALVWGHGYTLGRDHECLRRQRDARNDAKQPEKQSGCPKCGGSHIISQEIDHRTGRIERLVFCDCNGEVVEV